MVKGFDKLEQMRKQLDQKGLFLQFKKQETVEVVDIGKEIREEQKVLDTVDVARPLSIDEAIELGEYFTKNELLSLVAVKFPNIYKPKNLKLVEILIRLSEEGVVPLKPERIINCKRCGKELVVSPIKLIPYWELSDSGRYCDDCEILIKKLNEKPIQVEL